MSQRYRIALCVLIGIAAVAGTARGAGDVEGSRDHPLFTRLPDYYIDDYEEAEFEWNGGQGVILYIVETAPGTAWTP